MTYREFIKGVEDILSSYKGKTDKDAYFHIHEEIKGYIDSLDDFIPDLKPNSIGMVSIDTREDDEEYQTYTSNMGTYTLFHYTIEWKKDRRTTNGLSSTVESIKIQHNLDEKYFDLALEDIPQTVHYLLAVKNRKEELRYIKALEEEIKNRKETVVRMEKIMELEAFDKAMLRHDMEENE